MRRTSITIPESLKEEIDKAGINLSALVREVIKGKLEESRGRNRVEALILNEKLRRKAHPGWDSTKVIRLWRERR